MRRFRVKHVSAECGRLNLAPEMRNQKGSSILLDCKCEEQMERLPLSKYKDRRRFRKGVDEFIQVIFLIFALLIYSKSGL